LIELIKFNLFKKNNFPTIY